MGNLKNTNIRGFCVTVVVTIGVYAISILGLLLTYFRFKATARSLIKPWAKMALWLYGIKVTVEGELPKGSGVIFAARHTSLIDTYLYTAVLPSNTIYVAKKELSKIPIVSTYFSAVGGIFVDRQKPLSAAKALKKSAAKISSLDNLFVHPEGTRKTEGEIGKLFSGMFFTGEKERKVVPISSFGGEALCPKGQLFPSPGHIKIVIGNEVDSSKQGKKESMEIIRNTYLRHIELNHHS